MTPWEVLGWLLVAGFAVPIGLMLAGVVGAAWVLVRDAVTK